MKNSCLTAIKEYTIRRPCNIKKFTNHGGTNCINHKDFVIVRQS